MNSKKWTIRFVIIILICLLFIVSVNFFVDPYGYFRAQKGENYTMDEEDYLREQKAEHIKYHGDEYDAFLFVTYLYYLTVATVTNYPRLTATSIITAGFCPEILKIITIIVNTLFIRHIRKRFSFTSLLLRLRNLTTKPKEIFMRFLP